VRFTIEQGGLRVDKALAEKLPGTSRKALAQAFADGRVRVDGKKVAKGAIVGPGQVVEVEGGAIVAATGSPPVPAPEAPLDVVLVDEGLVAVNKPAGWPTHPLLAGELGSLASAVIARYPECVAAGLDAREGGAAHRLDRGTTGLVLFARSRPAYEALRAAFHAGQVKKTYLALVVGACSRSGEIDAAILQRGGTALVCDHDDLMATGALPALTRYRPLSAHGSKTAPLTLLECEAATGRMHQVRVHLAHAGYPVVGDLKYGLAMPSLPSLEGHFLHASRLELAHPITAQPLTIEAPLPAERQAFLAAVGSR
jgi:23S rRNA pseudouridine1911/1915/1917 synthase